jgi:hypothetical protein
MEIKDRMQNLIKYSQVLYSDGILYDSGQEEIATPERKSLILSDLKLIKEGVAYIEKHFMSNT